MVVVVDRNDVPDAGDEEEPERRPGDPVERAGGPSGYVGPGRPKGWDQRGKGELTAKVKFFVHGISAGAKAAVEKAGGSVDLPEVVATEHEKKTARREVNKTAKAAKVAK